MLGFSVRTRMFKKKRQLWWHSTISTDQTHIRTFRYFRNPFYNLNIELTYRWLSTLLNAFDCQRPWDLDDSMPIFKPWFVLSSRSSHLIRILIESAVTHCPVWSVNNIQPNEIMSLSYEIAALKLLTRQMPSWTDTSFYIVFLHFFPLRDFRFKFRYFKQFAIFRQITHEMDRIAH